MGLQKAKPLTAFRDNKLSHQIISGLKDKTVGLARAGAPHNILVNAVQAGFIDTPMQQRLAGEKNLQERIDLIPLKRAGKPRDVAGAVVYLASAAGDFITSEIISVTGGD